MYALMIRSILYVVAHLYDICNVSRPVIVLLVYTYCLTWLNALDMCKTFTFQLKEQNSHIINCITPEANNSKWLYNRIHTNRTIQYHNNKSFLS